MKLTQYTIERAYPVSADRLYAGFTDPELLKQWIWGEGMKDVQVIRTCESAAGSTFRWT